METAIFLLNGKPGFEVDFDMNFRHPVRAVRRLDSLSKGRRLCITGVCQAILRRGTKSGTTLLGDKVELHCVR